MYFTSRKLVLIIIVVVLIEASLALIAKSYLSYQITRAHTISPERVIEVLEQRAPKLDLEQYYKVMQQ